MKPNEATQRISIHPKDIVLLTGYSESYARRIIRTIKHLNNKQPHQLITIKEFANHMGWEEDEIRQRLR